MTKSYSKSRHLGSASGKELLLIRGYKTKKGLHPFESKESEQAAKDGHNSLNRNLFPPELLSINHHLLCCFLSSFIHVLVGR